MYEFLLNYQIFIIKEFHMKKVIRLNENDIEKLVKKIIKEDGQQAPSQGGQPTQKKKEEKLPNVKQVGDGVLPGIDNIIRTIQGAKREYEDLCNAKLTGNDGYSKEIDGIVNDFSKLEDKVRKSKEIITNHLVKQRDVKKMDYMKHQQQDMSRKRMDAQKNGKPYFY